MGILYNISVEKEKPEHVKLRLGNHNSKDYPDRPTLYSFKSRRRFWEYPKHIQKKVVKTSVERLRPENVNMDYDWNKKEEAIFWAPFKKREILRMQIELPDSIAKPQQQKRRVKN